MPATLDSATTLVLIDLQHGTTALPPCTPRKIELLSNRGPIHRRQPIRLTQIGDLHEHPFPAQRGHPGYQRLVEKTRADRKAIAHTPVTSRPGARTHRL